MEHLKMQTPDTTDANIEKIAALFPNCVTERKNKNGEVERAIDFDRLRQELSKDIVEGAEERYQFTWPDKRKAMREANKPTNSALRPCREESEDFDHTENLYIEGDNLEVLKCLRETYLGRVKMIYIDPPYNTGNEFVYNDDFAVGSAEWDLMNNRDKEGNILPVNNDNNGRFHTDWLNMMYPRLRVARDILSEDGVIFISIDDNEVENLKKILDEIYGDNNFVGQIVVAKGTTTGQDANGIGSSIDYMLMYAKNKSAFHPKGLPLDDNDKARFNLSDAKGLYSILQFRKTGSGDRREDRPNLYFPVIAPDGSKVYPIGPGGYESRWRADKKQYDRWLSEDMILWKIDDGGNYKPYVKYYLEGRTKQVSNLWNDIEGNKKASITIKELLGNNIFPFPKPIGLLMKCLNISTNDNSLILDFFSGSATTAHAVMQLNAEEDGGKRKFIMVQLPEPTEEKSEAYKAGYKNICEIGKERIRRAGKKIKEEHPDAKDLDTGFRVLKLDSSNMKDVYYTPGQVTQTDLFDSAENIKEDRSGEDLLFQVMLECNIPLSASIETKKIKNGKDKEVELFSVNNGYLLACFDKELDETLITQIAQQKPYYFVMRDSGYDSDNVVDNFDQIFNYYSKETIRRVL
ncbi:MAG: site-specific DNA-methyltransferase [Bacteroidales bacterium]|nr:site-specific DNA-methyltransferase [Bacteroidales bacterium]